LGQHISKQKVFNNFKKEAPKGQFRSTGWNVTAVKRSYFMGKPSRVKGYVVGSDLTFKGRKVWKVKVKDPVSRYHGKKLVVASVQGGLELANGINVHFVIGTVDDSEGAEVLRAIDVCPEAPKAN
jgi:hypothetical protein